MRWKSFDSGRFARRFRVLYELLLNKYWVDELYDATAVRGTIGLANGFWKFIDVAMLFASLDPRLARVMFSKLARAVLDLEPNRRTELLQRTGVLEA